MYGMLKQLRTCVFNLECYIFRHNNNNNNNNTNNNKNKKQ